VVAAFIEAFWSSRTGMPFGVKIGFGVALAVVFALYLTLGGRKAGQGGRNHAD